MTVFSTGVIENRKRTITNLAISISNEGTKQATVIVEVYDVPSLGLSNAVVYFLHEFTLNPFDTPDSILTFDNVFANLDRFGVRVITVNKHKDHDKHHNKNKEADVAVTVTGLDGSANTVLRIFPGDLLKF